LGAAIRISLHLDIDVGDGEVFDATVLLQELHLRDVLWLQQRRDIILLHLHDSFLTCQQA
jgi:hypothetical protein